MPSKKEIEIGEHRRRVAASPRASLRICVSRPFGTVGCDTENRDKYGLNMYQYNGTTSVPPLVVTSIMCRVGLLTPFDFAFSS
jgi:hypothetical protein